MKCLILLALVCMANVAELAQIKHTNSAEWAEYKLEHGKVYATPEEDAGRFARFQVTLEEVGHHRASKPGASFSVGLNHLSDWTKEELAMLTSDVRYDAAEHEHHLELANGDPFLQAILDDPSPVPDEVNWRLVPDRVSGVRDQGQCGASWAFATVGVLEGQQVPRNFTRKLEPLSEQDIVDCSKLDGGCTGVGLMSNALEDIAGMGGIESEHAYPYKAESGACKFDKRKAVMSVKGSVDLPRGDESALKKIVANYGPVAVAINASGLKNYVSGIYDDDSCSKDVNHAILVYGYGVDAKQTEYWLMKNSWGQKWGESGYFKMRRGKKMCGVGKLSTIATF